MNLKLFKITELQGQQKRQVPSLSNGEIKRTNEWKITEWKQSFPFVEHGFKSRNLSLVYMIWIDKSRKTEHSER